MDRAVKAVCFLTSLEAYWDVMELSNPWNT